MAVSKVNIEDFLLMAEEHLVIDVRSPSEYAHARFPKAISLPLFTDEERKLVGTAYKQDGREDAIKIGLGFFKMREIVETVEQLLNDWKSRKVLVHCWRGGMRSGSVAWLLDLYGFEVFVLEGGYKNFRNWVLKQFEMKYKLQILGGLTGCGKTEILKELKKRGHSILDLEELAGHKGSAFGDLGLPVQESNEQFENKLALALRSCLSNNSGPIWVESESSRIGNVGIFHSFFAQMSKAPRLILSIPFEKRLDYIMKGYGHFTKDELKASTLKIKKRLGGLETQKILTFLDQNNIREAFYVLLLYYDRVYKRAEECEGIKIENLDLADTNAQVNASIIENIWMKK